MFLASEPLPNDMLFSGLYQRAGRKTPQLPPQIKALLQLLLDAKLVRVTALLLAAVHGLGVKAGIAPVADTRQHSVSGECGMLRLAPTPWRGSEHGVEASLHPCKSSRPCLLLHRCASLPSPLLVAHATQPTVLPPRHSSIDPAPTTSAGCTLCGSAGIRKWWESGEASPKMLTRRASLASVRSPNTTASTHASLRAPGRNVVLAQGAAGHRRSSQASTSSQGPPHTPGHPHRTPPPRTVHSASPRLLLIIVVLPANLAHKGCLPGPAGALVLPGCGLFMCGGWG